MRESLLTLLTPAVEGAGCDLEDVTVSSAGRRSVVRVIVDADRGVDLDTVADVSRAVSDLLDGAEHLLAGAYVLEVSSPGVDRPLSEPRHWRRAVGRLVEVAVDGTRTVGRVVATDDTTATLEVSGTKRTLAWAQLGPGRVQIEFGRAASAAEPSEDESPEED